jgi:hypothetical protein
MATQLQWVQLHEMMPDCGLICCSHQFKGLTFLMLTCRTTIYVCVYIATQLRSSHQCHMNRPALLPVRRRSVVA